MRVSIFDNINPESFYMGFEEPENTEFKFDLKILEEIEKHQAEEIPEVVFPFEKSNIHPLFEQICDIIRPPSLKDVETARIKAEKKMNKLRKINIEIKELNKLV